MQKRSWFRVVVDDKGKAVDCRPVGDEGTASLGIFFILAVDAKEAARKASNEQARVLLAARRARYAQEGRCKCGGERDDKTLLSCARCRVNEARCRDRIAARKRGEDAPKPDRRTVLLERKATEAEAIRLSVLEEARAAWRKYPTVGGFTRWLEQEITKLAGKKVA